jgi:TatD DNase family protein
MPTYIDTHAHLYLPEFDADIAQVIRNAREKGIEKILLPNIESATTPMMHKLCNQYPDLLIPMMGLHPCSVKENWIDEMENIRGALDNNAYCAVGEIGLDYYWDISFKKQQIEAFEIQMGWAIERNMPIAIHSRASTEDCIKYVAENRQPGFTGVFHCFSGTIDEAWKIIDMGFFLGIGGVLTFKKAGLDLIIREIPLTHLILETDAPYLAPDPFRGKRNESAYIPLIAEKLALTKGVSIAEVAEITTANARKLFSC